VSAHGAKGAVNRQKVNVTVIAAQNLLAADIGGKSDPFVQLIVRNRGSLKQTSTKQKTTSPAWNEEFELCVAFFPVFDIVLFFATFAISFVLF
jgi:Ca2+-dependent lipid-binding protein